MLFRSSELANLELSESFLPLEGFVQFILHNQLLLLQLLAPPLVFDETRLL